MSLTSYRAAPHRDTWHGYDEGREVQRIHRAYGNQLARRFGLSHRAQQTDRFGQSELLAAHSTDEMAASNFPARLQPAIHAAQLKPGNVQRFTFQQSSEQDAVAAQQHSRVSFSRLVARCAGE